MTRMSPWTFLRGSVYFDGLVQERRNSRALAMELRLSCTNPSIYSVYVEISCFVIVCQGIIGNSQGLFCCIVFLILVMLLDRQVWKNISSGHILNLRWVRDNSHFNNLVLIFILGCVEIVLNTLWPIQNDRHFSHDIFECISLFENSCISV